MDCRRAGREQTPKSILSWPDVASNCPDQSGCTRRGNEPKSGEKQIEQKEQALAKLKGGNEEVQRTRKGIQCEIAKIRRDLTEKTYSFLQAENSAQASALIPR